MYFATDVANFLACPHITTLNREREEGKISKKVFADPGAELLRKLGLEHEQKYLDELKARGLKVVEIATDVSWSEAAVANARGNGSGRGCDLSGHVYSGAVGWGALTSLFALKRPASSVPGPTKSWRRSSRNRLRRAR